MFEKADQQAQAQAGEIKELRTKIDTQAAEIREQGKALAAAEKQTAQAEAQVKELQVQIKAQKKTETKK